MAARCAARRFAAAMFVCSPQSRPLIAAAAQLFVFLGGRVSAVVFGASRTAFAVLLAELRVVPL